MIPELFGKYRVIRLLGRGGMADVYEARDTLLDRRVAIKTIHPHLIDDNKFLQRFQHEAKLLASLRHPHIVRFYDFDIFQGRPFMVIEYLGGGTLANRFAELRHQQNRLPQGEMIQILEAVAAALDYAHAHGAIHRDIKPANILFTTDGVPVITDFGITKILSESLHISLTGSVIGTPAYMAPEQASCGTIDRRTDIYSLGIMLYEMSTGRTPFQGKNPTDIIIKHLTVAPPEPRQFNPDIPYLAQEVILKALAKEPADRYDSAGEFARNFHNALESEPVPEGLIEHAPQPPTAPEEVGAFAPSSMQVMQLQEQPRLEQPPGSEPLSEPLDETSPPFASSIALEDLLSATELTSEEAISHFPEEALPATEEAKVHTPQPSPQSPAKTITGRFVVQCFNTDLVIPAGKSEILIGREDPFKDFFPEINLDPYGGQDAGVSRRHARIRLQDGQTVIEDLNTTNGTLLNKRRLTPGEAAPLSDGDELCLGKIVLVYHTE